MEIIDKSFTKAPGHYIVQSLLALAVLTIILYFVEVLTQAAIVAALGASTFIVFAMPRSITAQPRRLVGGHAVGIVAHGWSSQTVVLVLLCALGLATVRRLLLRYLRDLF